MLGNMFGQCVTVICALVILLDIANAIGATPRKPLNNGWPTAPVYTREYLLSLRQMQTLQPRTLRSFPEILCPMQQAVHFKTNRKKRGSRGGYATASNGEAAVSRYLQSLYPTYAPYGIRWIDYLRL